MTEVRYLDNNNNISQEICRVIERKGNYCRIETPDGQILRIFNDRLRPVKESVTDNSDETDDIVIEKWTKESQFNGSTICKTVTTIRHDLGEYHTVNLYNGVAKKPAKYQLKDINKLRKKLTKKGYRKSNEHQ